MLVTEKIETAVIKPVVVSAVVTMLEVVVVEEVEVVVARGVIGVFLKITQCCFLLFILSVYK